jgi:hypothetical protein
VDGLQIAEEADRGRKEGRDDRDGGENRDGRAATQELQDGPFTGPAGGVLQAVLCSRQSPGQLPASASSFARWTSICSVVIGT